MANKYGQGSAPVEQQAVLTQTEQKVLPSSVQENPSLVVGEDQAFLLAVDEQVQKIMAFFLAVVPSNYSSQIKGPFYTMQFQAAAEQIARIQVQAAEVFNDADYDFTRPEFLYQIIGLLIFPDTQSDGTPQLPSDIAQRKFLKDMAGILLKGATKSALFDALKLLTDADIQIIEKAIEARNNPISAYTLEEQFQFEITISRTERTTATAVTGAPPTIASHYHTLAVNSTGDGKTLETIGTTDTEVIPHVHDVYGWLVQPYVSTGLIPAHVHDVVSSLPDANMSALYDNIALVLKAIKPAHTLYEYRNLFREVWRSIATDSLATLNYSTAYYDDLRKYWWGAKSITGVDGITLTDRTLFSDATRNFSNINVGAALTITSGPNGVGFSNTDSNTVGRYTVMDVLAFPVPSDRATVPFTTSPTGLSGFLQIIGTDTLQAMVFDVATNQYVPDTAFNWVGIDENEILTISQGANAGLYRFNAFLGTNGGPLSLLVGKNGSQPLTALGPAYQVQMAPSLLRVDRRMRVTATGQDYEVVVDRLGVLVPKAVVNEDVSGYFAPVILPITYPPTFSPDFLFDSLDEPAPGVVTQSSFLTAHGPLVKSWGDFTIATINDVTVTVNGAPVAIESIDPYIGRINLAVPVQIQPGPSPTVEVSYYWMPKAIAGLNSLNTVGLILNQWDRAINHDNPPWHGVGQLGAISMGNRFLLGTELGPVADQEPLYLGYRFLGLERAYTASLNDPTTLLLNQNPHAISTNPFKVVPEAKSVSYEATTFPTLENWALVGSDSGGLVGNGTYTVKADTPGPYLTGQPAFYYQMTDLSLPSTGRVVVRFTLDPSTVTPTGVFTGVAFGAQDNRRAYIVGLLLLPPFGSEAAFRCLGFLLDPSRPDLQASWLVGPQTNSSFVDQQVTLISQSRMVAKTSLIPKNIKAGTRFRIDTGLQQGVYTVASVVAQTNGTTTITISGAFPADVNVFGAKYPTVIWEVDYSIPTTYALTLGLAGVNTPTPGDPLAANDAGPPRIASLYCSGALFGTFLTATATTALAQPAQVGPINFGYAGG